MRSLATNFNIILAVTGRVRFFIMLSLMVAAALLEVAVVGLFFPYLDILLNPEKIQSSQIGNLFYEALSQESTDDFLRLFGGVVVGVVVLSAGVGAFARAFTMRYLWNGYSTLTGRMYRIYLGKPYINWRESNSDALAKNVISEVALFSVSLMGPITDFLARVIVLAIWITMLVLVDPFVAGSVIALIGGIYLTIFATIRRKLSRMAEQRFALHQQIFEYVNSSFRSIKDIKVNQAEEMFTRKIERPARGHADVNTKIGIISLLPRFAVEAVVFVAATLVLVSSIGSRNLEELIPLLSLYALAGFRMLPHAQVLFSASTRIKFNIKALDTIAEQLRAEVSPTRSNSTPALAKPFQELLGKNLSYRFPGADGYVFTNADFAIRAGEIVFIQGKSGLGKSTLAELLLGLLAPTGGEIWCNGVQLESGSILSNQINIGYVSQESILFEGTLLENVSLHQDIDVDDNWLDKVVDAACAREIVDGLGGPEGRISEGGKNLSAGQRQRVGLVRALYRNPELLVLDEATNALDTATEACLMANVRALGIAVVIITHQDSLYAPGDTAYDFWSVDELGDGQQRHNALSQVLRRQ